MKELSSGIKVDSQQYYQLLDWKEYRQISETEEIEFHIGGNSGYITAHALAKIEELLENVTPNEITFGCVINFQ